MMGAVGQPRVGREGMVGHIDRVLAGRFCREGELVQLSVPDPRLEVLDSPTWHAYVELQHCANPPRRLGRGERWHPWPRSVTGRS
jgi:hypothetical protein